MAVQYSTVQYSTVQYNGGVMAISRRVTPACSSAPLQADTAGDMGGAGT